MEILGEEAATAHSGYWKCKERVSKFIWKAWMVASAAQTGLKLATVTCEMRICGDWTELNASVKFLTRAYLRRMWEAWPCWGGRTKPACMYVHCSLRARQVHNQQACQAYISKELACIKSFAAYHWIFVELFLYFIRVTFLTHIYFKNIEEICQSFI